MKNFIVVTGARPNFMKIAPLCAEFDKECIDYHIFNSGQHPDCNMNEAFGAEFDLYKRMHNFHVTQDNKIERIQGIMKNFKSYIKTFGYVTGIIVVGDVDTTFACSLVSKQFNIPLIHIEAGLRSFDYDMPEEKNRIVADHLSKFLFAPSYDAVMNLEMEGIFENIHLVGNIMIDTLIRFLPSIYGKALKEKEPHIVATFHRPENVDTVKIFTIINQLSTVAKHGYKVIFPMHPRTKKKLEELKILDRLEDCIITEPLNYVDFMSKVVHADCVITDSGGIQEETTYLNIPCFTVRKNTERPITIREGTNVLTDFDDIINKVINPRKKMNNPIAFWDGKTSERIVKILMEEL